MSREVDLLRAAEAGLSLGESHPDESLVCYPLKIEWEMLHAEAGEPFPAPERTSHAEEAYAPPPRPVLQLAEYARELSWEVKTQYARGCFPHGSTGRPGGLKESFALRFGAHPMTDRQAYAVYSRTADRGIWGWSSVMLWGPDLTPYGGGGLKELKDYLADPTMTSDALWVWVRELKRIAASTEEARKRRVRVRAQILKVSSEGRFEAARQESRLEWDKADQTWRSKVRDLADGVFSLEELEKLIKPKEATGGMR